MNHYDLIIVGGGLVGGALALALARASHLRIAVIDQTPAANWDKEIHDYSSRVSAVTHHSQLFLDRLNVWKIIHPHCISACKNIFLIDGQSQVHFSYRETNYAQLMWIVDNQAMMQAIFKIAKNHEHIHWYSEAQPKILAHEREGIYLTLDNGENVTASLLIGADGKESWVRKMAQIDLCVMNQDDMAIVANLQHEYSHDNTAKQLFLPTGTLATLPLRHPLQSNLIWSLPQNQAQAFFSMKTADFLQVLNQQSPHISAIGVNEKNIFPVPMQQAAHYIAPRIALVGDAAHVIHPMAGQGVNLGWEDAMTLSEFILQAHKNGQPIYNAKLLRRYERTRRAENHWMMMGVRALEWGFRQTAAPIRLPRQWGLNMIETSSYLKRMIVHFANQ